MEKKKCLIYCRVSSQRQVAEGHGLDSQETRCREYAKNQGWEVIKTFRDEGVSGKLFERPATHELIEFLDNNRHTRFIVLFDDFSRFARDVETHIKLKSELVSRGVTLSCLNFNFEDSPIGKFTETIFAANSQLHRELNRTQVIDKQRARLVSGYWPFNPPLGLVNKKDPLHGKLLAPQEPFAWIFSDAIVRFSRGLLATLEETRQYILKQYSRHGITRKLSLNGTRLILSQPLYFGLIQYLPWEIPLGKAQHKGFIDDSYYFKVVDIFSKKTKYGRRRDINADFPIRGLVNCVGCNRPLTGSWNKGRTKRYANYSCKTAGCPLRYKVIAKDKIEADFSTLLRDYRPQREAVDLTSAILKDVWDSMKQTYMEGVEVNRKRLSQVEGEITTFKDGFLRSENEAMKSFYEGEIEKLLVEKNRLSENHEEMFTKEEFGTATDTVLGVLKNPVKLWKKGDVLEKRTVFNMYFLENLPYDKEKGFGTACFSPVVGLLQANSSSKNNLVETEGVEPSSEKVN